MATNGKDDRELAVDPRLKPLAFLQRMRARHGDLFSLRLMGGRILVAGDPELARQVFGAPADVLHAGEGNRRVLGQTLGEHSLILLDGERHMRHRRLLLPALRGLRLERRAEPMRALAAAHLDSWPRGEEVKALPRLRALALAVVMRAALGQDRGREVESGSHDALADLLLPVEGPDGEAPVSPDSIRRAEGLIGEVVARRRRRQDPRQADDVLSLLLEAGREGGSQLSDDEICDELMTLIIAGTETTAGSLAWALERLARAAEALARVAAEASGGGGPYTDAAIQETLRMRPAVPMSARLVKRPFQLGDRSLSPGTVVALSALLIHHRPDIYPEPLVFRPERFLDSAPGTYTWIPFGGGVRRCIGAGFALQEMRIVLAGLLSRLRPRAADPEPEGMLNRGNTMVPARGARLVFDPVRIR